MALEDAAVLGVLSRPIDADRYIKACPLSATTLGTFFHNVRQAVWETTGGVPKSLLTGLSRERWISFRQYELREFMLMLVNAARILHGDVPLAEGLRRLGRLAYPSFASTMAGRVVLFAFGSGLEQMAETLPKAYAIGVPDANIEVTKLATRHYRIRYTNVHCFVDTYHLGVIEGAFIAQRVQPKVVVRPGSRICDAEIEGIW
jgi:uncharacterized protein (TIGR02265 family)